MKYYSMSQKEVLQSIDTQKSGLTETEVLQRQSKYGSNIIDSSSKVSPLQIFINQFRSFIIAILMVASIVSTFIGEYTDAIFIFIVLIANAIFGFVQEYKAENAIDALKRISSPKATVIREKKRKIIEASDLVPGDIIVLQAGDKVPADCRLLESDNLYVNEALLTGESLPVKKNTSILKGEKQLTEQSNMLFSGTLVTTGSGIACVVYTASSTEIGKIAKMISSADTPLTPLQKDLGSLGRSLGLITIIVCIIVFFLNIAAGQSVIPSFMTGISLAVAAIPEGLPAVVTISLALGVMRMVKKNSLIRRLPSVETLGATTVICTDKTGTLTHNQMTVKRLYVNDRTVQVTGDGYSLKGKFSESPKQFRELLNASVLCNDASLDGESVVGDPTEGALLVLGGKAKIVQGSLLKKMPRIGSVPFDSDTKFMITYHRSENGTLTYMKGAPEVVLEHCSHYMIDGRVKELTAKQKKTILQANKIFAEDTLRVLGFAYAKDHVTNNLTFLGLAGMQDPPRKEAIDAVATCHKAGIKVVMITGDQQTTAEAIASQIGIPGRVMNGSELDLINDLEPIVEEVDIYARVTPEHKLRIVQALQAKGHVVAMTGDGVNDSPALKSADIGVAVGSGTEVAKEASAMILLDDNFHTIVAAVEEGRIIYDNIQKFVNYLLSSNIGEVLVILIATLIGIFNADWGLALLPIQLLWINLITDGLPALALGVDPGSSKVMDRKPRPISEKIMNNRMIFNILFMGGLIAVGTLFAYWYGLGKGGHDYARTMAFTTLIVLEIGRIHIIRKDFNEQFFSNHWLIMAILVSLLLHLFILYTPLSSFFRTIPLDAADWAVSFGLLGMIYIIGNLTMFIKQGGASSAD